MKKLILLISFLSFTCLTFSQAYYKQIDRELLVVNTYASKGMSRNIANVVLPENTKGYIYRITLNPKGGKRTPTTLFDMVSKVSTKEIAFGVELAKYAVDVSDDVALDAFIFSSKTNATNFLAKKEGYWTACKEMYNRKSVCFSTTECLNRNIYFGFKNNNLMQGIEVLLEVVAIIDPAKKPTIETGSNSISTQKITLGSLGQRITVGTTYNIYNSTKLFDFNVLISTDGIIYKNYLVKALENRSLVFGSKKIYFKMDKDSSPLLLEPRTNYKIMWDDNKYQLFKD